MRLAWPRFGAGVCGLVVTSAVASPAAAESWSGLQALSRVTLEVVVSPPVPGLSAEELRHRVETASLAARPAPVLDPSAPDRLRLSVAVQLYSSAELRGFYLPFSGTYGIGLVRLVVERTAAIPPPSSPVRAVVWEAERLAKGPWRRAAAEIRTLVDAVVTAFLDDYRRAAAL